MWLPTASKGSLARSDGLLQLFVKNATFLRNRKIDHFGFLYHPKLCTSRKRRSGREIVEPVCKLDRECLFWARTQLPVICLHAPLATVDFSCRHGKRGNQPRDTRTEFFFDAPDIPSGNILDDIMEKCRRNDLRIAHAKHVHCDKRDRAAMFEIPLAALALHSAERFFGGLICLRDENSAVVIREHKLMHSLKKRVAILPLFE